MTHPTKMRRFKMVVCILLILSVFSLVLAAPVAVQEVREAGTDGVDGGDNVMIKWGKRDDEPSSSSDGQGTPSQQQGSSSTPNTDPNPSVSSGKSKPPLSSTSGGNELSWNPEGEAKSIEPGSSSKAKSISWAPFRKIKMPSGEVYTEELPETKPHPPPPPPPPLGMTYLDRMAALKELSTPKPQSKNALSKLSKLKFWRRSPELPLVL